MKLDDAIAEIERQFPCVNGLAGPVSQTGEPYTIIDVGGPVEEGGRFDFCSSAELAVKSWLNAVLDYAKDKRGTLYWRVRPTLGDFTVYVPVYDGPDDRTPHLEMRTIFKMYSRLLISEKPIIYSAADVAAKTWKAARLTEKAGSAPGATVI